ncbi:MAG: deoxyhypusine synthase [Candidatus Micrarchaeota archaeon]|nr:deoxyhypusine synthase [Candidatus Micrarchaeota archaeon]
MKPAGRSIRDVHLKKGMLASELVGILGESGAFGAKHLAVGAEITLRMLEDEASTNFFSFPSDLVATGLRSVIADSVKDFDVIVTTAGTIAHDLIRAHGGKYYGGSFELDDEELHKKGVYRLGNILIPQESYGEFLENVMTPILKELAKEKIEWGPRELIEEFGKRVKDKNSILYQAYKHDVPIYVPGITDGAFGTNLMIFGQGGKLKLDVLKDEKELSDIVFDAKRSGALMIGGGISKHHTIWWNQFKGGLDYAVYITTATQYDGSLSGARLKEAVSWGKIKAKAKYVTIDGDASVLLPLILAYVNEKRR